VILDDVGNSEGGDLGLPVKQVNLEFAAQAFESGEVLLLLRLAPLDLLFKIACLLITSQS
jgi:hypothetical protein